MKRSTEPLPGPTNRATWNARYRDLWVLLLLALAVLIVFWPLVHAEFINYDDPDYVTQNPHIRGLSGRNISWAFQSLFIYWQPLTWISYMADYEIYGLKAYGFHLTNVALHVVNSLVLFLVMERLTGRRVPSMVVALLFAIHPLHVETVAWISERKGLLSSLFWFLALGAYLRYAARPGAGRYLVVVACFVLGLMAKSMVITLPCLLLLLDWWPLGRSPSSPIMPSTGGKPETGGSRRFPRKTWRSLIVEKLPLLAISTASAVFSVAAQRKADAIVSLQNLPLTDRISNSLVGYASYLLKTVWPTDLIVFYPRPDHWLPGQVALSGAIVVGVSAWAFFSRHRRPFVFTGWFWFLGTLVPVIGLLQAGDQAIADRYTYVPLIGLFILAIWAATEFAESSPGRRKGVVSVGAVIVILCGVLGARQARHWQSTRTLFDHALRVDPSNAQVGVVVGSLRSADGHYDEAVRLLENSLRINPRQSDAHVQMGLTLEKQGKLDEAISHYVEAARIKPSYVEAHLLLGLALDRQGRPAEAIEQLQTVLRLNPESPAAHNDLAMILYAKGNVDEAIAHLETAVRVDPHLTTAHENLGTALMGKGDLVRASEHFRAALAITQDSAISRLKLGTIQIAQGNTREGLVSLREALRLRPDWPELLNDLAWILATDSHAEFRNGSQAVQLAEKACQLTGFKRAVFVGTLAAAQAETGRYDDAIRTAQKAHDIAAAAHEQQLAETNLKLMELYRSGKPFRSGQ
ncbi:MAG: tetratricopeptide repeat protein [Verrucomicrobiota bacterium]